MFSRLTVGATKWVNLLSTEPYIIITGFLTHIRYLSLYVHLFVFIGISLSLYHLACTVCLYSPLTILLVDVSLVNSLVHK